MDQQAQDFRTSLDSLSDIFVVPYLGCGTPAGNPEELNCSGHLSLCLSLQMTAAEKGPDNTLLNHSRSWL